MANQSPASFPTVTPHVPLGTKMDESTETEATPKKHMKSGDNDHFVENAMNLSLLDPPRFGWAALGGVHDVLPPHQSAWRRSSKRSSALSTRQKQRFGTKRARSEGALGGAASATESFGYSVCSEPAEKPAAIGLNDDLMGTKPPAASLTGTAFADLNAANRELPIRRFTAMQGGTMHVKTYHRGIEGDEPRDGLSGELRFPVKPSDTGFSTEGPSTLKAVVSIQFPLTPTSSTDYEESCFYRQTIQWDLGNPTTPTPMLYAAQVATEFGLSYSETLDLAGSIQRQLQTFCAEHCASAVPLLLKQGSSQKPSVSMCHLYGDVTGFGTSGGTGNILLKKPVLSTSQRSNSSVTPKSAPKTKQDKEVPMKKKAPVAAPERNTDSTERIFYREVLSRLQRDADTFLKSHWAHSNQSEIGVRAAGATQCHLCQERSEKCVLFPCGILGHTLCEKHMLQKHNISMQSGSQALSECPICNLTCGCSLCNCKHSILAYRLKQLCLQQGKKPQTTYMHDIHSQCVALTRENCKEFLRTNGAMRNFLLRAQAPKLHPDDFPREVIDGIELDLEYQEHYEMVFTSAGGKKIGREIDESSKTDVPSGTVAPPSTPGRSQPASTGIDGNTDFCMVCNKVGSLVCCDVCPRAFHVECLPGGNTTPINGNEWICPSCKSERDGLEGDVIDGISYIDKIKATYIQPKTTESETELVKVLSIILEMVEVLIHYDFGYMFRTPVDTKQVVGYGKIVKSPMDLGTIKNRILNGQYKKIIGNDYILENIVLAILKDVELVWHNCLLFNVEGSAVYRMAGVLSRRAASIREKSFDSMIPASMKEELARYINSLAQDRAEARKFEPRPPASTPRNRHKVANCAKGAPQRRRPIVGLDPDTGMIVKLYSTMLSLSNAVNILMSKGAICEYKVQEMDNTNKLRTLVTRSASDPSIRLFGYRWLFLDELYEKKVRFQADMYASTNKTEDEFVQSNKETLRWGIVVETSKGKVYFRNFDEALSLINSISDHSADTLRRSLKDAGAVAVDGMKITRLKGDNSAPDQLIFKQDIVAGGRTLNAFSSIDGAYQDWCDTIEATVSPYSGSVSMEIFKNFFLGKGRSVDGVRYSMVPQEDSTMKTAAITAGSSSVNPVEPTAVETANETTASPTIKVTQRSGGLSSAAETSIVPNPAGLAMNKGSTSGAELSINSGANGEQNKEGNSTVFEVAARDSTGNMPATEPSTKNTAASKPIESNIGPTSTSDMMDGETPATNRINENTTHVQMNEPKMQAADADIKKSSVLIQQEPEIDTSISRTEFNTEKVQTKEGSLPVNENDANVSLVDVKQHSRTNGQTTEGDELMVNVEPT